MKKLLLLFTFFASITSGMTQVSSNTCSEAFNASHITSEGIYTVGTVDGTASSPICTDGQIADNAEWFAFTPATSYNVTISSDLNTNGNTDTRIHVYSGSCGSLTCIAGDDDSGDFTGTNGSSFLSVVSFNVIANQTYYIAWDNRWSTSNDFSFEIIETPPVETSQRTFSNQSISTDNGSKMGVADMNGDFLDDIISIPTFSQQGMPTKYNLNIYYQQANGTFVVGNYFPEANRSPSWSLAAGDFDGNGYNDLVWGNTSGCNVIKANDNGTEYTTVANNSVFTQRTNFVDINNDGHLDIFVCHDTAPSVYYLGDGSGGLTFNPGTIGGLGGFPNGGNYGSVWIDYDNDRDIDMYMAKCGPNNRDVNEIYRNDGSGNFTEVSNALGLADDIQTWSAAWGDYNNDGYMDCFIGSSVGTPHKMMLNVPNPDTGDTANPRVFIDVTSSTGISSYTTSSIENAPGDFDNDGYVDILSGGNILYNNGDMTFTAYTSQMPGQGGIGDLNNDGFLDVYGGGASIRLNDGNDNNWIKIITIGQSHITSGLSNRNGIGARVEIVSNLGTQIRDVRSGEGFRYMSTLNTHFGIGQDPAIDYIRIYWPSGVIDQVNNPTINSTLTVVEGSQTLSTDDTFVSDLIVYPNPTKSVLNLNTLQDLNDAIYSVFDLNGRRVLNAKLDSKSIDVSSLSAGQYILRIVFGNSVKNQKFIKQ